jgi:hypothetical protein
MSKKRKRGRPKCAVHKVVRDFAQLKRTLALENVGEEKPHINDLMPIIMERLDEEERQRSLRLAEKWRNRISGLGTKWFNDLPFDDDDDDFDDYEELYSYTGKRGKKKGHKEKARKKNNHYLLYSGNYDDDDDYWENRATMFNNGEWSDEDDDEGDTYKIIKFYPDMENEMTYREFNSIKEFSDFCDENGYYVSNFDMNNMINQYVTHCCVDPVSKEDILTDTSYGALYWTVSGDMSKYDIEDANIVS